MSLHALANSMNAAIPILVALMACITPLIGVLLAEFSPQKLLHRLQCHAELAALRGPAAWVRHPIARSALLIVVLDLVAMALLPFRAGWLWLRCESWACLIAFLLVALLPLSFAACAYRAERKSRRVRVLRLLLAGWLIGFVVTTFIFWTEIPTADSLDLKIYRSLHTEPVR